VSGSPPIFIQASAQVPAPDAIGIKAILENQADLLALQCDESDCIAVVPDWWQVRLGADRPQLMVQYARKFSDGAWDKPKYVLSIPHWSKSKELTTISDFPTYQKGQYQGTTILSDNSKLIVNCITAAEAERVTVKLLSTLPPLVKVNSTYVSAFRRGRPLAEILVYPRIIKYFATGQRDLNPTWVKKFT